VYTVSSLGPYFGISSISKKLALMVNEILKPYTFTAKTYKEDDGTVTISLNEIDLVENALTEEEALKRMASAVVEYANDYYNDFQYWSQSLTENRICHMYCTFICIARFVAG